MDFETINLKPKHKKSRPRRYMETLCILLAALLLGSGFARFQHYFSSDAAIPSSTTELEEEVLSISEGHITEEETLETATILQAEGNWGLSFQQEGQAPIGNTSAAELAKYDAHYVNTSGEKVIYLTFDAGYENGNTETILDALKKHNAPATFFVVGTYITSNPTLIQRMVDEGHAVGNHTYHHPDMSQISTLESFQKELESVEQVFEDLTGSQMLKYYRPPQGKYSESNLSMAQQLGYHTFFWSLAYVDWYQDNQPTKEEAFEKLLGRIHPGAIVLLHSTSSTNATILDELLTKWEEMGYTFRPLSDFTQTNTSS
jgi:peptidoglycan-N-acetylmuramic acid deacetylase